MQLNGRENLEMITLENGRRRLRDNLGMIPLACGRRRLMGNKIWKSQNWQVNEEEEWERIS